MNLSRSSSTSDVPSRNLLAARRSRSFFAFVALCVFAVSGMLGCDRGPTIEEVRALQAQALFEDSLEPLRQLLETSPDDPEINFRYGAALNRTTSSPVAVWSLRKASEDPTWAVRAHMELASGSLRTGNYEAAIESASKVLEAEPEHVSALSLRGSAYLNGTEDPESARVDFETILDIDPGNGAAMASLAAALLFLGEVDEAEQILKEVDESAQDADALESTRAILCATRATLLAERHELVAAEESLEGCLELFPNDTIVVEQAVLFFDQTERGERATRLLTEALEASPNNAKFRSALSTRALAAGDPEKAESILREATTLPDPEMRSWAWVTLTNLYIARDDIPAAIESYREAMALAPEPSQLALLTLADLLAREERHEEALEVAAGLERDAYRGLIEARIHLNEFRPAEALARLEETFPSWPNNAGARYYAARAAEQLGDFERAIEEYRQSIRSDSKQTEAGLRLAKTYLEAGALQNAWNSAAQYFRIHPRDPDAMRVLFRAASIADPKSVKQLFTQLQGGPLWSTALSIRAGLVESREGPEAALALIDGTEEVDLTLPTNAELLRTRVRLQLVLGQVDAASAASRAALDAHDDFGAFHEIHAAVLQQTGGTASQIRAALVRAVELAPRDWIALESFGQLEEDEGHLDAALELFQRAIDAAPQQESPGRALARALQRGGRSEAAERAWEDQLREHPWDAQAALTLSRIRSEAGNADDRTLELAERAVLFHGGAEAQKQLIALHRSRGEDERAQTLSDAIQKGQPLAPTRITPIDGV